jgi:2',3'-cyclic-nucleotide 2'-phosphodiesterase
MNILFVGDIVGRPGRRALRLALPDLRADHRIDFVIANGENAAAGFGVTQKVLHEILDAGVDCVTSGNHVWAKKEVEGFIGNEVRLLRPANFPEGCPGRGAMVYRSRDGRPVAVANLQGRVFMQPLDCPFAWFDAHAGELRREAAVLIVDFHAEATSEKQAIARHADGRASAVLGTHTHVQTSDEQILPGGTAYITDCGMTGPVDSIIGTQTETIIKRFRTQLPQKFEVADGPVDVCGVVVETDDDSGRARRVLRFRERIE